MKMLISLLISLGASLLSPAQAAGPLLINGAGATFPYPLYSKWIYEFHKTDPNTEINYNAVGSGGGVRQLLDQTVDFGASDAPMSDENLAKSKTPILHIPTVLGAVVLSYNLPGVSNLKLNGELIADIFLGKIQKWDDPRIQKLNPKTSFPKGLDIVPVSRSDASGTSAIFTDYLAKVSPEWKTKVGVGTAINWPAGLRAKGNDGVTALLKQGDQSKGRIGYVELVYAKTNNLEIATLQNKAGQFVSPSIESVTAAAAGSLKSMPGDFRVSITNAEGKASYPISSFTYLLVYKNLQGEKGKKLVSFLNWSLTEGQKMATNLFYAPLPSQLVEKVKAKVKTVVVQ